MTAKELILSSGSFNPASVRGKWNMSALKAFITQNHKPQTEMTLDLKTFYKTFYNGSKVIKYVGYYSRTHVLEVMKELELEGYCHQIKLDSGEVLKIGFQN